jgi:CHASE2 domain-containing sensor protein
MRKIKKILDFRKFEKGKRAQFILNIAAGLVIVLIMHGLENTQWGEDLLNSAFDCFIRSEAKEAVKTNENPGDLLLIDIVHHKKNEKKEKQVDKKANFLSPRDTIAGLMEMAFAGEASVIVLDFAFEENDCCHPDRDNQLSKVLEENKNKKTKVIFPVRIGQDKKIQKLIFDEEIDKNPNYARAISTFLAFPEDAVVRHWKAFQKYKDYEILWGIPVLAVALHKGKEKELENLESLVIQKDKKIDVYPLGIETAGEKKTLLLPLQEVDPFRQRIRFRLIPKDCIKGSKEGNIRIHNIKNLTPQRFKNKIVIIGNSDPGVGDVLSTPVGDMAGMYIQANAIHTLLKGYQPKRTPWWVSILIDLFIILCAAYLFHYMDTFWKDLLVIIVGIFGLGAVGYFCFFKGSGIFPNFVFGIAAIGYIEIMNSLKDILVKGRKKKRPKKARQSKDKK